MGSTMTDKTTHKPGCEALGGYGHGIGPCSCSEAQPEALRLAEFYSMFKDGMSTAAASELRRLHAEIQQLKAAAQAIAELLPDTLIPDSKDWQDGDINQRVQFLLTMREANQQYCADLEAQLSARQAAPDVWRLVPVEPTIEMFVGGMEADCLGLPSIDDDSHVRSIWSEMLSAAPLPAGR